MSILRLDGEGFVRVALSAVVLTIVTACAGHPPTVVGPPPIPPRHGELVIDVVYPRDSAFITARDSNFIFGSVGNGAAQLVINGDDVRVEPNGSFLAWLPVPGMPGDSVGTYRLTAALGGQEVREEHTVRLPRSPEPLTTDSVVLDPATATPRGAWWVREREVVPIGVRASPGARVRLLLPDSSELELREVTTRSSNSNANWVFGQVPTNAGSATASGIYRGELIAYGGIGRGLGSPELPPLSADLSGVPTYCAPPQQERSEVVADTFTALPDSTAEPSVIEVVEVDQDTAAVDADSTRDIPEHTMPLNCAVLEVVLNDDTVRTPLPLDLWVAQNGATTAELREEPSNIGSDGFIVGRAAPGATTLWMWKDGVRVRVTGRRNGAVRVVLDGRTEAWVALDELAPLPGVRLPARARVGTVRFKGLPDRVEARVEVSHPVPYQVEVDDRRISLILYGAYSSTDWLRYGPEEEFVRIARWEQVDSERYVLHVDLAGRPWGYRVKYVGGGLLLEIRKAPRLDSRAPLSGLVVAVDAGHPPAGATGPTRLYEGDANLAIAFRLKRLLEAEGVRAIMTRTDRGQVRLYDRTYIAELLDAHVLVSIHNNALPDGVDPFANHGTSVYYFHPQSQDLAQALQRGLLDWMGLPDLGYGRSSLALARPTWMPAALTEGAFMMIPAQEAGLRDPEYQEAYARGVVEGLRAFVLGRME